MPKRLIVAICAALALALAWPAAARAGEGQAQIGDVTLNLAAPEGLGRVEGLSPAADAYIQSLEPKFKLTVYGLYGDREEWLRFVALAGARRPASIPRFAMLCAPQKMPKKSYDAKKGEKELKRYATWFSFAANTDLVAALLTAKGNKKLTEKMGVDIGFKFHTDNVFTQKFAEYRNSLSLGALTSFSVFGQPSDVYLTVSALKVGDKLVFLAYFEASGDEGALRATQAKSLAWRDRLAAANGVALLAKKPKAAPAPR